MFHAVIENEAEFLRDWNAAVAAVCGGTRKGLEHGIDDGAQEARTAHRFKSQTGRLEKSINAKTISLGGNTAPSESKGEIVATETYASFVEGGTKAHDIRPKAARGFVGPLHASQSRRKRGTGGERAMLAWQSGGKWHFAKIVHHPGTKPLPFMALAYFKCERIMIKHAEIGVAEAQLILDR